MNNNQTNLQQQKKQTQQKNPQRILLILSCVLILVATALIIILLTEQPNSSTEKATHKPVQTTYYDVGGNPRYIETYTYYDNGLLCSSTVHSVETYSLEDRFSYYPIYSFLYLYDAQGNQTEHIYGALSVLPNLTKNDAEVSLSWHDPNGESCTATIFPERESIEQEKFGIDPTKTKTLEQEPTLIPTRSINNWASIYLSEVMETTTFTDGSDCSLIFVNNDDIPELWIDSYGTANGQELFTIKSGGVDRIRTQLIKWVNKGGKLLSTGGRMDHYQDYIYEIQDGKFVLTEKGEYGNKPGQGAEFDEEGHLRYYYYWNDEEMTEDAYYANVKNAFEDADVVQKFDAVYTPEQCKILLQYIADSQ